MVKETKKELENKIKELELENDEWRHCASYDAMMDGPRFKGWNKSALDRCRHDYIEKEWKKK